MMMMSSSEERWRNRRDRRKTAKYIKYLHHLFKICIFHHSFILFQILAPSVVGMVADLEFMKSKVKNIRERWTRIQSNNINQVRSKYFYEKYILQFVYQDTDFGFSDVSIDKLDTSRGNQEKKTTQFKESTETLDSDDAEVSFN